ncbi:sirohydrochlorin chelatase [Aneurinibacillus terranovensis]|uniref:sirohydrochlorin chelatase n=1 Tax=Aneurinibacillus terranovensis TaxID=278991 RepID=UPI000422957D|nr:CbiX/SirB N-terminal domain-containing protein [Aneurinibacillus terranovensis]
MKQGVLVISHGSRKQGWVDGIEHVIGQVNTGLPLEAVYLELVEGKAIYDGIRHLEEKGVEEIIAVPLFVCSGSTHLAEIRYALGVSPRPSFETDLEPLPLRARVTWAEPMDDHPLILEILKERISRLSTRPEEEVLMVAAHGSELPGYRETWEAVVGRMTASLRRELGFKGATYGMIHPDTIRQRAEAVARKNRLIVLPLFLSGGYFTERLIPQKLAGIPHQYDGSTYLPDEKVARWIEQVVARYKPDGSSK